jgi:hypothetical protein
MRVTWLSRGENLVLAEPLERGGQPIVAFSLTGIELCPPGFGLEPDVRHLSLASTFRSYTFRRA